MMRNKFTLLMLSATAFLISCGDDLEIPTLAPSFVLDPSVPEVGLPVMFDNTTLNANEYSWDFGDDNTSTEVSPSHTYAAAGSYDVTLIASSVDGQDVTVTETIEVRERVFTGYQLSTFPLLNDNGDLWDLDETSADSANAEYPDVLIAMFPVDETNDALFIDGVYPNVTGGVVLSAPADNTFDEITLTNEDWVFAIIEIDGDLDSDDADDTSTEDIIRFSFNPVVAPTIKSEDGTSGVIRLFLPLDGGQAVDVELFFEL
ncbi:MAG: PKD domain-containing protein [Bacteroidota bacterium]